MYYILFLNYYTGIEKGNINGIADTQKNEKQIILKNGTKIVANENSFSSLFVYKDTNVWLDYIDGTRVSTHLFSGFLDYCFKPKNLFVYFGFLAAQVGAPGIVYTV
jgi:hypothetical protein